MSKKEFFTKFVVIMTIGIIVAMDKERDLVVSRLQHIDERVEHQQTFTDGRMGQHRIVLLQCGIGKVAAAVGAVELIRRYQPDCIINTGVAGALSSAVDVMDVVAAARTVYHDVDCFTDNPHGRIQGFPLFFESDKRLLDALGGVQSASKVHVGLICSGDQFISDPDALHAITDYFPDGLAVDMESCAIAQVCYMYDVPFLSLRIISDTPGITNHEHQYFDFWREAPERSFAVLEQLINRL